MMILTNNCLIRVSDRVDLIPSISLRRQGSNHERVITTILHKCLHSLNFFKITILKKEKASSTQFNTYVKTSKVMKINK